MGVSSSCMRDPILYQRRESTFDGPLSVGRPRALVANGWVKVGDYVRELPAQHIQPCSCCLCRPIGGERPSLRVHAIRTRDHMVFLQLDDDYECPADEVELVHQSVGLVGSA